MNIALTQRQLLTALKPVGGCLECGSWEWVTGTPGSFGAGLCHSLGLSTRPGRGHRGELPFPPCGYFILLLLLLLFWLFLEGKLQLRKLAAHSSGPGSDSFPSGKSIPFGGCPGGLARAEDEEGMSHSSLEHWRSLSFVQGVPWLWETASSCAREGVGWILGKIPS